MGIGDILKAKENKRLIEELTSTKIALEGAMARLTPEQLNIIEQEKMLSKLQDQINQLTEKKSTIEDQIKELEKEVNHKNGQIIQLDDEILLQDFGLYRPLYDFSNSDDYKQSLEKNRDEQKAMIKDKTCVNYFTEWTVNGSKSEGRKMTNNNIKQIMRSFNIECENAIDRVKFNNFDSMKSRIQKSFESLNKINECNKIAITQPYLNLKMEELHLAIEYAMKKQAEKEEQKRIREEIREEAKLQKEIEEARRNISKEQKHYNNALEKLNTQIEACESEEQKELLLSKRVEIEGQLEELAKASEDVDYREANQRAGYVYIISNIGSFGENIYKIGMTRRLEPIERIDELGDASVPFNFDVHAMIFTEDAPKLEATLHKAFEDRKLNMINTRREFFHVSLEEIEKVIRANFDKTVDFINMPPAEQYRQSLLMKQK